MIPAIVSILVAVAAAVAAFPLDPTKSNPVATLWTLPNETWIKNLAVRANGNVLCTSLNRAAIYQVDPFKHAAETMHQFESTDGCLGIAETSSDVFVFVTANVSLEANTASPGSTKIRRVDVRALEQTVLPLYRTIQALCSADAAKGVVWRVNTATGDYNVAIEDPNFKPKNAIPLGVNGIRILNSELYFTNLATNSAEMTITPNGSAASTIQILTTEALAADDFAFFDNGIVYTAGANTLWRVSADGHTDAFVGDPGSTVLQGITSTRFGRTAVDKDVVYLSTQGGLLEDPPGSAVHGGQLLAVNVNVVDSHGDEK